MTDPLQSILNDSDVLLTLLQRPDRRVPTCPDWTVRDLVGHVGGAQRWPLAILSGGGGPLPRVLPEPSGDLASWFEQGAQHLVAAMRDFGEDAIVWNPFDAAGQVDWWIQKIAVETGLHRWDGENAYGDASPIDNVVAGVGIDEMVTDFLPGLVALNGGKPSGVVELVCADRTWIVPLGDGVQRCSVTGSASDVLLFLWNRLRDVSGPLAVCGDGEIVDGWRELTI